MPTTQPTMQQIVRTFRYLVTRNLASQDIARYNAAEASATLRHRRLDREDVDAFLEASRSASATADTGTRRQDHVLESLV